MTRRATAAFVEPLRLAEIELPPSHPAAADRGYPVFAFLVRHPDGLFLVDTGVGAGDEAVDRLYRPVVTDLATALSARGIAPSDVAAVVNTHLHFDHCGQNALFYGRETPFFVQEAELAMVGEPRYTVPDLATIPEPQRRVIRGDVEIVPRLRLIATPGHTPGHQSVIVDTDGGPIVIGGQVAYRAAEASSGEPSDGNLHDPAWRVAARASLRRIRELRPIRVHLSHDADSNVSGSPG